MAKVSRPVPLRPWSFSVVRISCRRLAYTEQSRKGHETPIFNVSKCVSVCVCVRVVYISIYRYIHICIYIYIDRESILSFFG